MAMPALKAPLPDGYTLQTIIRGKDLLKIGAKRFRDFINPFAAERAYIMIEKPVSLEEERKWLKETARKIDAKEQVKLILSFEGKIAGVCDAMRKGGKERHNIHFGLAIVKAHRGKEFGELLLRKGIKVAKEEMKPHKMWIEHVSGNNVAAKLYRKVGFVPVSRLREYVCHFGKWHDRIQMEYRGK